MSSHSQRAVISWLTAHNDSWPLSPFAFSRKMIFAREPETPALSCGPQGRSHTYKLNQSRAVGPLLHQLVRPGKLCNYSLHR